MNNYLSEQSVTYIYDEKIVNKCNVSSKKEATT